MLVQAGKVGVVVLVLLLPILLAADPGFPTHAAQPHRHLLLPSTLLPSHPRAFGPGPHPPAYRLEADTETGTGSAVWASGGLGFSIQSIGGGLLPGYAAYDAEDGYVYVPNYGNDNVSVIRGATVIANVEVGGGPFVATYDLANGFVYVHNLLTANVSVLNGTTVFGSVSIGVSLDAANYSISGSAYDPTNGCVYVPNTNNNTVSVINGTTVVANVSVAVQPTLAEFDPVNGYVYVTALGPASSGAEVTILNGTLSLGSVSFGGFPGFSTVASDGQLYVPNSSGVSIINGSRAAGYVNFPLGSTYFATSDPATGEVDVTGSGPSGQGYDLNVTVINGSSVLSHVFLDGYVFDPGYDPANGLVFAPSVGGGVTGNLGPNPYVAILNGTTILGGIPDQNGGQSVTYDGADECMYVINGEISVRGGVTVVCPRSGYSVGFSPLGLPGGSNWSVTFDNWTRTGSGPLSFPNVVNGTYSYTVRPPTGYFGEPMGGSLNVSGGNVSQSIPLVTCPTLYCVNFNVSGLPRGANWSVTLGNKTETGPAMLQFVGTADGTYAFAARSPSGYVPTPPNGTVKVNGSNRSLSVQFRPPEYAVVFAGTGPPLNGSWSVVFNGSVATSTGASIRFLAPNGTYQYSVEVPTGFFAIPHFGNVTVGGLDTSVIVRWLVTPEYPVTFNETGLPNATGWAVTLGQSTQSSLTGTLTIPEANGSYQFSVRPVAGFVASHWSGEVVVNGSPDVVQIRWIPFLYTVTFTESGLIPGTPWTLTWNGVLRLSETDSIPAFSANGSGSYAVGGIPGWTTPHFSGTVVVNGSPVPIAIAWSPTTYPLLFTERGLPPGTEWNVTVAGVALPSTSGSIPVSLANASYEFTVGAPPGYTAYPPGGTLIVIGSGATHPITFSPKSSGTKTTAGLPKLELLAASLVGGVVVGSAVAAALWARRSRGVQRRL
jgi:YVTN family beta-propeller protein